ncbi:phosphoserine phosphatase SerB [Novosphingobium cyanobacteriorum]|uniref:Phosphoserine phosphatase n=1 Tax=Novosphingobium cyanobacteriorum TaxID=3024215 RepID=A0ABT6CDN2_9SPHN|nr:phosphoserine phosphatase SerB [Novosphingobium cyanobacteriorum]MDF8331654.1 phosphoserine phosphatase SerB [Novosphingobium cyanobacteriorum]
MIIARLIADPETLGDNLALAMEMIEARDWEVAGAGMLEFCTNVLELEVVEGNPAGIRQILDQCFPDSDLLLSTVPFETPRLFVSDMDSTMIGQECIDELADFAGLKDRIAAITERAMQGELDFESALRERVGLLKDLPEDAIRQCLDERIRPMDGARTLVATLKSRGCHTVLVTGGFHSFADPVADLLGFDRVVGNRLGLHDGRLTGDLVGGIVDSSVKKKVLLEETARLGEDVVSLATGDGANDIPMIESATHGIAYRAKPKARAAADGWIDRGDLTAILDLYGIARDDWVFD